MERNAKPIIAKPRLKIFETKPKGSKWNQQFYTAKKPRKETNAKPRVATHKQKRPKQVLPNPKQSKFIINLRELSQPQESLCP